MKQFLALLTFIIIATTAAYAQPDRGMGGISIPRSTAPVAKPTPAPVPSDYKSPFKVDPFKKEFKSDLKVGGEEKPKSVIIEEKDRFVTGGSEYKDRVAIKPEREATPGVKGNIDYGIIRTKSPYITLMAYDFGAEDGDRVKITLNDKVLFSSVTLSNIGQGLLITLNEGFNDLRVEALNQGTSGPNTGGFTMYDNQEVNLKNSEWNLFTGFHGKFLVIKE